MPAWVKKFFILMIILNVVLILLGTGIAIPVFLISCLATAYLILICTDEKV